METDFIKNSVGIAVAQLKQVRDQLVLASQHAMRQDDADWSQIEGLMSVIKRLDLLRQDIDNLKADGGTQKTTADMKVAGRIDKSGYPKYIAREDGAVVRIGLSQDGSEYEHVAKEYDFRSIIETINRFVHAEYFAVDEVQKQLNLPTYLTHLVISLLRETLGKLKSPKRGRYAFVEKTPLNADSLLDELRVNRH